MSSNSLYVFKSERLGFRNWELSDLDQMAAISGDPEVMAFFPKVQDKAFVLDFIVRMQKEFTEKGFCYFAVEILETSEFIGFIGLHQQTFESDFTPCIDIGWRLKTAVWNQGYAAEGAKRCIEYGFSKLGIDEIFSMTPKLNLKSERIMQKAGMHYVKDFDLELLKDDERLRPCILYQIQKKDLLK